MRPRQERASGAWRYSGPCARNEIQAPYGFGCAFWLKLHWPLFGPEAYLGAMAENTTTAWPPPRAPQKTPLLWRPSTLYQVLIVLVSRHVR